MKTTPLLAAVLLLALAGAAKAQVKADRLKEGDRGVPDMDAKVMQVVDGDNMLVGVEDPRNGDGSYSTWVWVKCPTKGITDGKFYAAGQWKDFMGTKTVKVTGTKTYKTANGASRTVFVIEPDK
jgi:endonuclease YncB( thermonuclease family)